MPDRPRLDALAQWLQQEDDALLYEPDGSDVRPELAPGCYILDGHTPVPVADVLTWGRWFETADRTVARTAVAAGVEVSTVFLGLDHHFTGHGPPLLFETMVFHDGHAGAWQERYAT
jgi:hypothetical protein